MNCGGFHHNLRLCAVGSCRSTTYPQAMDAHTKYSISQHKVLDLASINVSPLYDCLAKPNEAYKREKNSKCNFT